MKQFLMLCLMSLLLTDIAYAQWGQGKMSDASGGVMTENPMGMMMDNKKWYIGMAGVVTSQLDFGEVKGINPSETSGYYLFTGYNYRSWLDIELGYTIQDNYEEAGVGTDIYLGILELAGLFKYSVTPSFEPYMRLGIAYVYGDVRMAGMKEDEASLESILGIGVNYHVNDFVSLRADYTLGSWDDTDSLKRLIFGLLGRF